MMKKISLSLLMTTVVLSGILFYITSCQKQQETSNLQNLIEDKSIEVTEHILAFKAKMEYYRNNPDLKTGGKLYTADSAILELESLLNYNFCYTDIQCNKKTFETSEVTMPLDELEKINDPDLMQVYYDKVIYTIQAQMGRVDYENMKLLLVDLEVTGTDSNGDAIVSVGALIGNNVAVNPKNEVGWWYGYLGGTCTHVHQGELDAALILEGDLQFAHIPAPPPGYIRRYTIIHTEGPLIPNHPNYRIENDPLDNYMDYRVYYATNAVNPPISDDTKCISDDIEMPFYLGQYDDFIDEFEIQYQLEFVDCILEGLAGNANGEDFIQHNYTVYLGNVWLVPVGWVIEDIMTYTN